MSALLDQIRRIDPAAASVLEEAGIRTDSDIQCVTRDDLREFFPGHREFKRRKTISGIIHEQKPINVLLGELRDFIPLESLSAALTGNGVLVDYLRILKDMKTQMDNVQTFLVAHINLLEDIGKTEPNQELQKRSSATSGPVKPDTVQTNDRSQGAQGSKSTISATNGPVKPDTVQTNDRPQGVHGSKSTISATSGPVKPDTVQTNDHPQGAHVPTVKYQMVVSGKTFGAHKQLIDKIKDQLQGKRIQLEECSQGAQIIFLFCPIVSRLATDVNEAMTDVKGDTPVILVLMHHTHVVRYVSPLRTWTEYSNVVLHVNVFYHEKSPGLLKCQENTTAVSEIQNKLLSKYTSADTPDEGRTLPRFAVGGHSSFRTDRDKNRLKPWWQW